MPLLMVLSAYNSAVYYDFGDKWS